VKFKVQGSKFKVRTDGDLRTRKRIMELLLEQIEKGLNANLYYLSLFVALCIPDICGALEPENGRADGEKV
jgi:hypothetical protein